MSRYGVKSQKLINLLVDVGIKDKRVLQVINSTPREMFVDGALTHKAYENTALPIGLGQTISQPYMVAKMTELVLQNNPKKVLEVGTGSGYQAAILAQLVPYLFTIERIKSLQIQARLRLKRLNLHNVAFKYGDGWLGWKNKGLFDAIVVTAAAKEVPPNLLLQLAINGQLIIPVGNTTQQLKLITKTAFGFQSKIVEAVRFVPLVNGDLA